MPGMNLRFSVHNALTHWGFSAFPLAVAALLVLLAVWYLRADWRLAERGRRWRGARTASFLAGLVTVDLAFQSSIATYAGTYFQAHVLQHLLLMVVAPPLLALGAPSTLLLQTSGRTAKSRWLHFLRSFPFAVLTHPVTVFFLYFGLMFVFFLTGLIGVAMQHMALMDLVNVLFLLASTLYWWPLVGLDPILHWRMSHGQRLLVLLMSSGLEAFLGVAILNDSKPIAPMYSLASTHAGGALLWVSAELATVGAFVPIFLQWVRAEAREGARVDKRLGRLEPGMPISPGAVVDPEHVFTPWELAWIARTGSVPAVMGPITAPAERGVRSAPGSPATQAGAPPAG